MNKVVMLNGKELSEQILDYVKKDYTYVRKPTLVIITVGEDKASKLYVKNKLKACEKCNIHTIHNVYNTDITKADLKEIIKSYNQNKSVDGIIIQQPLPNHLKGIENLVAPDKDVDGFTSLNVGETLVNSYDTQFPVYDDLEMGHSLLKLSACTPKGILMLLEHNKIELEGKHIVILGRSKIVGKPLIGLLLRENATVTSCNSYTNNLDEITKTADIIISAIGKPKFINRKFLGSSCGCIIDVGINRDEENNLCGDCDITDIVNYWSSSESNPSKLFSLPKPQPKYITPVPGGIGPMTVAALITNIIQAYEYHLAVETERLLKY